MMAVSWRTWFVRSGLQSAAGPRYTDFVTQFPSAFTAAASFDRDLIEQRAIAIGKEFRGKGINVELGPVTGGPLGRSPHAGRNWEGELCCLISST